LFVSPEVESLSDLLKNVVVWVTGSGRRLGREMSIGCAREGAAVVVHWHKSRDEAEQTTSEIVALGGEAMVVQGDHGSPADVSRIINEIVGRFGRLTALVNSASVFEPAAFADISEDDFFETVRTNLYGPFLCAQKALPHLREASPGRIVNITDWAVAKPYRGFAHYMAAKGGLDTLTRAMARELAPQILVNAIAPGPVLEPDDMREDLRRRIVGKTPIGRWCGTESVVRALIFILSSGDLCGETIFVDGGRRLG
jgi:pteridine reductase